MRTTNWLATILRKLSVPLPRRRRAIRRLWSAGGSSLSDSAMIESLESRNLLSAATITSPTSDVTTSSTAMLGGNVESDGGETLIAVGVVYALTSDNSSPQLDGANVTNVVTQTPMTGAFTISVSGLAPGADYSFVAYATNAEGTTYTSPVSTFNASTMPTVTSPTVTNITTTNVTLGGDVTSDGDAPLTSVGVVYSFADISQNPTLDSGAVATAPLGLGVFSIPVSLGAVPQLGTYYYRAYATNENGTTYSDLSTFVVSVAPTVVIPTFVVDTSTSATLGASVSSDGGSPITSYGVVYALTSDDADPQIGDAAATNLNQQSVPATPFTFSATGLVADAEYSFAAYATNASGTTYTSVTTFTTTGVAPVVITPTATSITTSTAMLGGDVTSDGGSPLTEVGVVFAYTAYNSNPEIGSGGAIVATSTPALGVFSINVSLGAVPQLGEYSYRAYAKNANGTTYSNLSTFIVSVAPTVVLPTSVVNTTTSATLGGDVSSDGGTPIISYGVVYALTSDDADPQIGDANVTNLNQQSVPGGPFTFSATGLIPGSHYSFKAYATNADGTTYTALKTFDTSSVAPIVTSPTATNISINGVTLGGDVTSDGGSPLTAVGIIFSYTEYDTNPHLGDGAVFTIPAATAALGVFTVTSTLGAVPQTGEYAYRAYATNANGTTYSDLATFIASTTPRVTHPTAVVDSSTKATLGGGIADNGGSTVTSVGVVYSLTSVNSNPQIGGDGVTMLSTTAIQEGLFSVLATGLIPGAGYTYSAYGTNANGTAYTGPISTLDTLPANHAPSGTSSTVTTLENMAYVIKTADFGFSDHNDNPANSLLAVKFTALPTAGILADNGVAVTVNQFVSAVDIAAAKLIYTPTSDVSGNVLLVAKFQVEDNGGTAVGGVDLDPTAKVLDVNITHVNQAPAGTSNTITVGENIHYPLKSSDFGFTDPHDTPPNTLLDVKFTLLPTVGTLADNGVAVTLNQLVSAADIGSGKLIYTPLANLLGGPFFLAKFQVEDNGGTANGGVNLDPTVKVLDVSLVKVNHAPVGTPGTVTAVENAAYKFKTTDFGLTDPNDIPSNTLLAVSFTTLPSASVGTLTDNGIAVTAGQFVSAADINSGKLVFTPQSNLVGGPFFLAKFQVEDNGGTVNGGVNLDSTARVLDVNILRVNHAPAGTSSTVTTLEDTGYKLKATDFGFSDPNDTPANTLLAVKFTTLPTVGKLMDNGIVVTVGQLVTTADITSGKLVFTPQSNLVGGPFFLAKFQVEDNGGTANGGANLDPVAKILDVRLTSVNDAPVGTVHTVATAKNTAYTFKTTDFGFTDPNDSPPNAFLAVKITTLPLLGSLKDNGVAVIAGTSIAVSDVTSGKLKFTPAANDTGASYASFTFQVQDNGGTANGGINTDTTPRLMTISVT